MRGIGGQSRGYLTNTVSSYLLGSNPIQLNPALLEGNFDGTYLAVTRKHSSFQFVKILFDSPPVHQTTCTSIPCWQA